jgi:hypothetical protein
MTTKCTLRAGRSHANSRLPPGYIRFSEVIGLDSRPAFEASQPSAPLDSNNMISQLKGLQVKERNLIKTFLTQPQQLHVRWFQSWVCWIPMTRRYAGPDHTQVSRNGSLSKLVFDVYIPMKSLEIRYDALVSTEMQGQNTQS